MYDHLQKQSYPGRAGLVLRQTNFGQKSKT